MKFGGFLFLAAALAFAIRAHAPSTFDTKPARDAAEPQVAADAHASNAEAEPPALRVSPVTLMPLSDRAALREARAAEARTPEVVVAAATLPQAMPVPLPPVPVGVTRADASGGSLVRTLKRELRRVKCYDGGIDSDWDRSTRWAMSGFLERVNAALPVDAPDHAMLALLRAHQPGVCGETCPRGQAMNGSGRCMPNAVVAKEERKRGVSTVANANPAAAPSTPFVTTVTVGESLPTAAIDRSRPSPAAEPTQARRPPPLPGRMAMGGPMTARAEPAPKGWWETLIGGAPDVSASGATAVVPDRKPAAPKIVRNKPAAVAAAVQEAAPDNSANGASDGAGLQMPAVAQTVIAEKSVLKRARVSGRKSYKGRSAKPRYASRKWRGRNVQAMFTHPLGRM